MDKEISLSNADQRLMDIVWSNQPLTSPELCRLAQDELGWKRTTTYTVLKRLCEKGCLKNENTVVTAVVEREEAQRIQARQVMERSFGGSLPRFIAAFMDGDTISEEEAQELQQMLDDYKRRL